MLRSARAGQRLPRGYIATCRICVPCVRTTHATSLCDALHVDGPRTRSDTHVGARSGNYRSKYVRSLTV
eukprot:5531478-Prymnesium_polylepis.1